MRRTLLAFTASFFVAAAAHAAPEVGKPAPDFFGNDALTGKIVSLGALKGKTVVLEWNNDGCPFVVKHYASGNMQQLQADAAKDGVVWITVNSAAKDKQGFLASKEAVEAQLKKNKSAPTHYILDSKGMIGKTYDAKVTPHMFVVDAKGTLVYAGGIDSIATPNADDIAKATPYLKNALAAVKAGKPVAEAQTKPYGCGVKYAD